MHLRSLALALPLAFSAMTATPSANAFCGFYVAGADQKLFNNATMVVMMREGTRTVLSMANNYQGPPENFAMVVPVPVVLQQENVKTLPAAIFDKVDQLAAPRLVEYWEEDPCAPQVRYESAAPGRGAMPAPPMAAAMPSKNLGVTIEAQFEVGEYQVVILSAKDSTGLDTWLKQEKYKIPDGAEPLLRPYVQAGSKFFVAKVNAEKVTFEKGMAKLSPLRFHYDSDTFSLPVRLGLINANGKQDLIVHILARNTRYELANYKNVTIPTNLDVDENARGQFGTFYAALFDRTLEENPRAVVTEYAWDASTCDPCPGPSLGPNDLATLGLDVLPEESPDGDGPPVAPPGPNPFLKPGSSPAPGAVKPPPKPTPPPMGPISRGPRRWMPTGFVLTRLHARYGSDSLGEDLVFRSAQPIVGGREFMAIPPSPNTQETAKPRLETGSQSGSYNNFQGRYAIRHPWKGPITCANPRRGIWGGPPAGETHQQTTVAKDVAFAPRGGVQLASFVRHDVPEIHLQGAPTTLARVAHPGVLPESDGAKKPDPAATPATSASSASPTTAPEPSTSSGCGACAVGGEAATNVLGGFSGLVVCIASFLRRKKRRNG